MRSRTPVIVLGAGRGSRMGGPKALMEVGGRAWWEWQRERLGAAGFGDADVVWVVSGEVGKKMGRNEQALPFHLVEAAGDAPMFESVMAGLESLRRVQAGSLHHQQSKDRQAGSLSHQEQPRGVFVLPVDVPAAAAEVFDALGAETGPSSPVVNGERGHPMFLPWRWVERNLSRAAVEALRPERRRLDELTSAERRFVQVEDATVLVNLNTPADVAKWAEGQRG